MPATDLWDIIDANMPAGERRFADIPGRGPVSYEDVRALSARFAHALTRLNVAPGDRVAVQVEKSLEALMLYLACLRLRRGFRSAQYGIYDRGNRVFPRGRRAGAVRLRSGSPRRVSQASRDRRDSNRDARRRRRRIFGRARGRYALRIRECGASRRRSCRDFLHIRHHRPLQGRDAQPRQSGLERADAARLFGGSPATTF